MSGRTYYEHLPNPGIAPVIQRFREVFSAHADEMAQAAAQVTQTPLAHHREEIAHVLATLELLPVPRHPPHGFLFRSRGRVLFGLPANEPLVVPTIITCASLLGGNHVRQRPATRTRRVVERTVALLAAQGLPDGQLTLLEEDRALVELTYNWDPEQYPH